MEDCDICLKRVTRRQRVKKLPCGHNTFHGDCLAEWMKISPTCPLCKAVLQNFATQCASQETQRQVRARRRTCMAAGLGNMSQYDEDLLLAAELSMMDDA